MPKKLTTSIFIERAKEKHGNKYDYSTIEYKNTQTKVIIVCPIHGEFSQWPRDHMRGHGCARCGNEVGSKKEKLTTLEFIHRAKEIHKDKYDYSTTRYKSAHEKLIILCPDHGEFTQHPYSHLSGHGCKPCANANVSRLENKWLAELNITDLKRHEKIYINENNYYRPDGYDPTTNTIYEFFGDYWHGNPKRFDADNMNQTCKKSFGELYNDTINKVVDYKQHGYKVVYIWESDFLTTED